MQRIRCWRCAEVQAPAFLCASCGSVQPLPADVDYFAALGFASHPALDERELGARYYELRDSLENVQTGVLAAPNQPLVHAKATGTSPRFVVSYRPLDDVTLYATAARGYRPGGPNVGLPDGLGCALVDAYSPIYDPDSVWNYEIGAKTELLAAMGSRVMGAPKISKSRSKLHANRLTALALMVNSILFGKLHKLSEIFVYRE